MIEFQGMMVLATNQIWWTAEVENVFKKIAQGNKRAMKDVSKTIRKFLISV